MYLNSTEPRLFILRRELFANSDILWVPELKHTKARKKTVLISLHRYIIIFICNNCTNFSYICYTIPLYNSLYHVSSFANYSCCQIITLACCKRKSDSHECGGETLIIDSKFIAAFPAKFLAARRYLFSSSILSAL